MEPPLESPLHGSEPEPAGGVTGSGVELSDAGGGDAPSLYSHYEILLTAGMRRHLALCAEFYRTGGAGPWWQTELQSLEDGYRWCSTKLAGAGEPQYRLNGFELLARG